MSSCGSVFSKAMIFVMTAFFWAASACLIFVGAYVWSESGSFDNMARSTYTLIPTVICIASGIFLFLVGVIGCFACLNENRCLLSGFFIILLVILIGEIASASLGVVYRADIGETVDKQLEKSLKMYHNESGLRVEIDAIQTSLQCCGVRNFTDWFSTPWESEQNSTWNLVPKSCCQGGACNDSIPAEEDARVFPQGCLDLVETNFSHFLALIVAFCFVVALLQVLGMLATCILMCRSRRDGGDHQRLFGEPQDGMHV